MDNCPMPFMWNQSLKRPEDLNRIDVGLSCFTDSALRLDSHNAICMAPLKPYAMAGSRKCNVSAETRALNNEVSLALELGGGGISSCSKTNYVVPDSGRDGQGLTPDMCLDTDLCLDFNLSVGKVPYKDIKMAMPMVTPEIEKREVDLELSLSTIAAESDLTSVTQTPSPTQLAKAALAYSSIEQLVDEGSTSSKWKRGPLLTPVNGLQVSNVSALSDGKDSFVNQVTALSVLQALPVQPVNTGDAEPFSFKQPRKTSVKTCQFPGCQKGARGASGFCISHGGGRRCQKPGCQKGAEGKTAFCKAHGGGRRCEFLGCTKSAEGRTSFCISHGGGRRCSYPGGCLRAARGKSGFCIRHGGGKRCKVENCTKSAEGIAGLCIAHGGGRRCQYPNCTKGAQGSTKFCKGHGGGKRCTYPECTKGAEGSTSFCKGHGGGKRCSFGGGGVCSKSVHGGTLFCVSHGGGKRCGVAGCTKSARGRTDFCVRHGGGKRCKFEGCKKSAQGSTDFCKAHGGGKHCLWGQPGSVFGGDTASPCDKSARGKIGLCSAHSALVHDKRVHGDGTVGLKMEGTNTENLAGATNFTGEGTSAFWSEYSFGANKHGWDPMQIHLPDANHLAGGSLDWQNPNIASIPEGRVHGGGLMALMGRSIGDILAVGRS